MTLFIAITVFSGTDNTMHNIFHIQTIGFYLPIGGFYNTHQHHKSLANATYYISCKVVMLDSVSLLNWTLVFE